MATCSSECLAFHYHELFDQADDYLVWQFFFLQNTTGHEALTPQSDC